MQEVFFGLRAASTDATDGLAIGVGGKPLCIYVLYGDLRNLSAGSGVGHQLFVALVFAFAYWSVASICRFIFIKSRFQIMPDMMRISSGPPASRSIRDAIVSAWWSGTICAVVVP